MSNAIPDAVLSRREPGARDYVRFVVICAPRTGSYMLTHALNYSPHIVCFGEVFNPLVKHVDYRVAGYRMHDPQERELRDQDFERFLRERIYAEQPKEVGAVGFKAPHNHFWTLRQQAVLEWLVAETDIRVLHLQRRNVLRRLLSERIAADTGGWIDYSGHTLASLRDPGMVLKALKQPRRALRILRRMVVTKKRPWQDAKRAVTITPEECREFFAKETVDNAHYDERFSGHEMHILYYEDLVDHFDSTLNEVQTFLGLKPRRLVPLTRKQNPEPLRELIANYDELYAAFADTPEAAYFD